MRSCVRGCVGAALLGACGPVMLPAGTDGSSGTSSAGATSTSTPTSTVTSTSTTSTDPSASDPSCADGCLTSEAGGIVVIEDASEGPVPCDTYTQDCKDGQKCAPWAEGGGNVWNSSKCVPVTGDRLPGESCMAEGSGISGIDDCVKAAFCWDVDAEGHGVCVALCGGSSRELTCGRPGHACADLTEVFGLCLASCQPLVQECEDGRLCLPAFQNYFCVLDGSGDMGAAFDPCDFANACDPGLICLNAASASECDPMAASCCLPMCSIAEGGASCPGEGQVCLPMYEPQPEGFEDVGYCSLKQ